MAEANDKVVLALGAGGRNTGYSEHAEMCPGVEVKYVCDVDEAEVAGY